MEGLIKAAEEQLADRVKRRAFRIPQSRGDMINLLHQDGKVIATDFEGNDVLITAVVSPTVDGKLRDFLEEES